ncbi:hypothetical protein BUALT_Bualt06G0057300 [Buddleja alternifolia]|uniref:BEN domain-containing protein n=1 Tax=Buddleja alternifolia TaxID=168488 RepID=A0AAV6XCL8_9LAMI|nr:hypothetical protein BUALT_Bualt06G0057300 [Buddleja alternifolia]
MLPQQKVEIIVNVLAVSNKDMNFIYILASWEGSAADCKILCDAVTRDNGLQIPRGEQEDGSVTEIESRNVTFLENDFPSKGEIKEREPLFELNDSNTENLQSRSLEMQEDELLLGPSGSQSHSSDVDESQLREMETSSCSQFSSKTGKKADKRRIWSLTGYLGALEQSMVKAFPGTDLHADPYINSKIHVWKKTHSSLATMPSRSGFNFNYSSHVITIDDDDVWDKYVKTDSNARTMRSKSFPFYLASVKDRVMVTKKSSSKRKKSIDSVDERMVDMMGQYCIGTNQRLGEIAQRIGHEFDASEK